MKKLEVQNGKEILQQVYKAAQEFGVEAYAVGGGGTRFVIHLPKAGRQRS